jgi:hypothetical protein
MILFTRAGYYPPGPLGGFFLQVFGPMQ